MARFLIHFGAVRKEIGAVLVFIVLLLIMWWFNKAVGRLLGLWAWEWGLFFEDLSGRAYALVAVGV